MNRNCGNAPFTRRISKSSKRNRHDRTLPAVQAINRSMAAIVTTAMPIRGRSIISNDSTRRRIQSPTHLTPCASTHLKNQFLVAPAPSRVLSGPRTAIRTRHTVTPTGRVQVSLKSVACSYRPHFLTCFLKEPLSVHHESGEFHDDPLQRAPLSAVEDEDSIAAHYNGSRSNYFHDNSTAGYFSRYG